MTTVVANRELVATDSLIVGDHKGTAQKVFKVKGHCVGIAGTYCACINFIRWYKRRDKDDPPEGIEDVMAIALTPSGELRVYEGSVNYFCIDDDFTAIGSGAGAALGAMFMGANPQHAIKIASKVDAYTGGRVQIRRRGK